MCGGEPPLHINRLSMQEVFTLCARIRHILRCIDYRMRYMCRGSTNICDAAQPPRGVISLHDTMADNVNFAYRKQCNRCRRFSRPSTMPARKPSAHSVMIMCIPSHIHPEEITAALHAFGTLSPKGLTILEVPSVRESSRFDTVKECADDPGSVSSRCQSDRTRHIFCEFVNAESATALLRSGTIRIRDRVVRVKRAYDRSGMAHARGHFSAQGLVPLTGF